LSTILKKLTKWHFNEKMYLAEAIGDNLPGLLKKIPVPESRVASISAGNTLDANIASASETATVAKESADNKDSTSYQETSSKDTAKDSKIANGGNVVMDEDTEPQYYRWDHFRRIMYKWHSILRKVSCFAVF
jgi:hypothetical protein